MITEKQKNSKVNYDAWFDKLIATIVRDRIQMSTGIASPEKQSMYISLMTENVVEMSKANRDTSSRILISEIVNDYINEINDIKEKPLKLALKLSVAEILVWAEINDDDEEAENKLLLSEAKLNAKYNNWGFYINSTIVEKSDGFSVPPHYSNVM